MNYKTLCHTIITKTLTMHNHINNEFIFDALDVVVNIFWGHNLYSHNVFLK